MLHPMSGRWTAEMLPTLPDDGNKYEVIDGELYVTPRPTSQHQVVLTALIAAFRSHLVPAGAAAVLPDVDLRAEERSAVRPDLVVVALAAGSVPRTPLSASSVILAIEILSASTREADHGPKRELYMRLDIPEYWIVDVERRAIERWRHGGASAEIVHDRIHWRLAPDSPELTIEWDDLFAWV
jgi:Uma2 family endonuclease